MTSVTAPRKGSVNVHWRDLQMIGQSHWRLQSPSWILNRNMAITREGTYRVWEPSRLEWSGTGCRGIPWVRQRSNDAEKSESTKVRSVGQAVYLNWEIPLTSLDVLKGLYFRAGHLADTWLFATIKAPQYATPDISRMTRGWLGVWTNYSRNVLGVRKSSVDLVQHIKRE